MRSFETESWRDQSISDVASVKSAQQRKGHNMSPGEMLVRHGDLEMCDKVD